ncbi:MAG: bifunctional pantoate--beta-alanine ligase/(d)CMP kinase [Phormidium sp. BM_Day4_Bin.17]|nr:bifunctional pantoate--beta-alanine ligase/(d)CMP kinase [Phormidium sp. BM_Day4_Bin.17]UCJ13004.1 MAG: bifunctional pantoate--beta-alanine ligase/(d)CMP kinase [Phormidium sp. PBR-2020]
MKHLTTIAELRDYRQGVSSTQTLGLIPTMGNLHAGHLSLIRQGRSHNDQVIVSIFLNPLQFGPNEDLARYPQTLDADLEHCREAGVDAVFCPQAEELGISSQDSSSSLTQICPPEALTSVLCGRSRPGHFQGVATIVSKLFNLIQPHRAYFGEKDAQQLVIIRRLVADLNFPIEIIPCPVVREKSGLAYSSRNQYLSDLQREQASVLYRGLAAARSQFQRGEREAKTLLAIVRDELAPVPQVQPEYVELVDPQSLVPLTTIKEQGRLAIAAHLGSTRLIDTMLLTVRQPIVAIDGPAGAGKSTVTRKVADKLGLLYLDTGAMYRAVTWYVLECGISVNDEAHIAQALKNCEIRLEPQGDSPQCRVWVNQHDVTQAIRSPEVTAQVSTVAAFPAVREFLVRQQQEYGAAGGLVAEGRDMGTQVFPDADVKIFLTASVQERARRRQLDLEKQGYEVNLSQLEADIAQRDQQDSTRAISPLQKAEDAIEIQTDDLTVEAVVSQILSYVPRD